MTIVDDIVEVLAGEILRGELEPGQNLPPFRKLAERFDTTLPTAQRVVGRIAELGLVHVRQGSGARVVNPLEGAHPGVYPYWVAAVKDRPAEARILLDDFLAIRRELAFAMLRELMQRPEWPPVPAIAAVDAFGAAVSNGSEPDVLMELDLAVTRALLNARGSAVLATIFNAFTALLRAVPELQTAMYATPELNVAAYRALMSGEVEPRREMIVGALAVLDEQTATRFEKLLMEKI